MEMARSHVCLVWTPHFRLLKNGTAIWFPTHKGQILATQKAFTRLIPKEETGLL